MQNRVVQCNDCGLSFLNPRPTDNLVSVLYNSDYFSSESTVGFDSYFSDDVRQNMLRASRKRLAVLLENANFVSGDMLEIGCATGEFCHTLHERGVNATGIDISESAITEARSRYKAIPFHVGTIDNLDSEIKFDMIFAFEVIEHLTDPSKFFKIASKLFQ